MRQVPAAVRTLAVLRALATAPGPMPAATLARQLEIPRSSMYHLLDEMQAEGFVTYYPEDRRWGLGVSVFEVGSAYLRHDPLERLARPLLASLVSAVQDHVPVAAHLGILQGRETLYLLKETPLRSIPVVTDIGVRLPAHLTATGRAILAQLSGAEVRALFPNRDAFIDRTGKGPTSLTELTSVLQTEKRQNYSYEDGFVTTGYVSIAVAVRDRSDRPIAALSCTLQEQSHTVEVHDELVTRLSNAAAELARRLGGLRLKA